MPTTKNSLEFTLRTRDELALIMLQYDFRILAYLVGIRASVLFIRLYINTRWSEDLNCIFEF